MYRNSKRIFRAFKNSITICSLALKGDFKKAFLSGCFRLAITEFSLALFMTPGRWKEEVFSSFFAIALTILLFSFVFPCLMCKPFKANS